ncbi:MAG: VOC family protein [Marinirhabdus sp.]
MDQNTVSWFEIPVADMQRAVKFYNTILNVKIKIQDFGGVKMGWFPSASGAYGATGSLIQHETYTPSHEGTLVYLTSKDVENELGRIESAGGKILKPKTMISEEHGYMALFEDTEGNRVALYSQK